MIARLWESVGEAITSRWALTAFGPSLVFWGGGLVAWAQKHNLDSQLTRWNAYSEAERIALAAGVLVWVALWATWVERMQTALLRLAEGYWPHQLNALRDWCSRRWEERIETKRKEWNDLQSPLTARDRRRRQYLDAELARMPVRSDHIMPTALGNVLRAAEAYPTLRYGLDAGICWPRLYPLLSSDLRDVIGQARTSLNEMTRLATWSLFFAVWTIWQPWALIGLPMAWMAYRGMVMAAGVYGDLIRTAFDLHRFDLYTALHWPLPATPDDEGKMGPQLTEYLFRGTASQAFSFQHPKKNE